ncbi:ABC transporter ATP-binding protein [Desulfobacula toluolica]|uniref:FecE: ABC-type iron(III) transporter, ATP-binding protein (ATPase) n=1 Tax=Desulfobacula toluolica (strain DSM 7467 / Tol2) TaxID=651182 RepID=K0NE65_DESTT|nr:ABC transporter ATP-binding protein [Desulfobacula toluolica]CCK79115.1 FecE: ABC-type iron(III) transporter, ATP-binding protein (ATPase) [Desulfobacula toluolica Tol2]
MTILALKNGKFSFGKTQIFTEVNFSVSKGETLCILGPNGCGKTTLIDCILGINTLHKGEIRLGDNLITGLSPRQIAQMIAYVPQKHVRHFSFSVMDILLMGRAPYTSFYSAPDAADIEIAEDTLDSLGLYHLKNRDYTRLSGGETQLVMIMRALIQDTPVIVMDEPTAHLDFKHELIVLETIVRLVKERGLTLVMATHFPNHAFYLENEGIPVQVAFMDRQKVHLAGSPSAALTEDNLESFYKVKTSIMTHTIPGKGLVKQIIPIQTMDTDK